MISHDKIKTILTDKAPSKPHSPKMSNMYELKKKQLPARSVNFKVLYTGHKIPLKLQ